MKYLLLCLLTLACAACNPLTAIEGAATPTPAPTPQKTAASATPPATPKPGAWMDQKKIGGGLGIKGGLDLKKDDLKIKNDRLSEPVKR